MKINNDGTVTSLAVTLIKQRRKHLCWGLNTGEIILFGGGDSEAKTVAEKVSADGSSSSLAFDLPYEIGFDQIAEDDK